MNNTDRSNPISIILTVFRRLQLGRGFRHNEVHLCINKVHDAQGNSPFWNHEAYNFVLLFMQKSGQRSCMQFAVHTT